MTHGSNLLSDFLTYDLKTRFTGEYLTKVDGGTMFHALEARSPFLDHKLWEFAGKLTFGLRMDSRRPKAVLREIVKRRIGPELAAGAKKGFGVPVQRWITKEWNEMFRNMMTDSRIEALGLINTKAVLRSLDSSEKSGWAPRQLWFILVLENWLRHEDI
jgi:asparagine synthase (glutamine-hydrolysing)